MLLWVCSGHRHRRWTNVVRTEVKHSAGLPVPLFYSCHILKSSVIYYWTDGQEHGICLSNISWQFVNLQNVEYMFLSQKNKSLTNVVHTYYTMLYTVHVGERNFQRILVLHVSQSACNSTKCQRNTDTSSLLLDRPYSATKFLLGSIYIEYLSLSLPKSHKHFPHCFLLHSCDFSLENLVLDVLINPYN